MVGWQSSGLAYTTFCQQRCCVGQSVLPNSGLNSQRREHGTGEYSERKLAFRRSDEVFRDPRSGREMERVRIRETVPQLSYQWKPAKKKPEWFLNG